MQPIIRRTITITITETWTITWADGHETSWAETHTWPADSEPGLPRLSLTDDDERENDVSDPDGADPATNDE